MRVNAIRPGDVALQHAAGCFTAQSPPGPGRHAARGAIERNSSCGHISAAEIADHWGAQRHTTPRRPPAQTPLELQALGMSRDAVMTRR
jgi:hypothetical protein